MSQYYMDIYEFENIIKQKVKEGKVDESINLVEDKLNSYEISGFHKIIGRDLLHLKNEINEFLTKFYESALESTGKVKALYCEMNGFTINYDLWFVTGASFGFCDGLDDTDWLADHDYYFDMALVVEGYEDLQAEYKDYMKNKKWNIAGLEEISDCCALLITLRLQQAFIYTYNDFKGKSDWASIPLFITSHDSEVICQIQTAT